MWRKVLGALALLALLGAAVFWGLTMPVTIPASSLPDHASNLANGKTMFVVGGCGDCHAEPVKACDDLDVVDETRLGGGRCLRTDIGTFYAPNISPDKETGIGTWSTLDFVNAMKQGVGPGGEHLYPAFPYTFYQRMTFADLIDLKAYLDTLPPVQDIAPKNDLRFPYNIRRGVGLFQWLYVDGKAFTPDPAASAEVNHGAYLVLGPAHCGACHSPRNILGGTIQAHAFAGARSPDGKGYVPNITPSAQGIGEWSKADITYYLETGSTPDFDVVGGAMVPVQENMEQLGGADRAAIAAYLNALPPRQDAVKRKGASK